MSKFEDPKHYIELLRQNCNGEVFLFERIEDQHPTLKVHILDDNKTQPLSPQFSEYPITYNLANMYITCWLKKEEIRGKCSSNKEKLSTLEIP